MKRLLSSALILGLFSLTTVGLVGCGETSKVEDKQTVSTPTGTATTTTTEKTTTSGSNPPPAPGK